MHNKQVVKRKHEKNGNKAITAKLITAGQKVRMDLRYEKLVLTGDQ